MIVEGVLRATGGLLTWSSPQELPLPLFFFFFAFDLFFDTKMKLVSDEVKLSLCAF
jgi:hypothetical protein